MTEEWHDVDCPYCGKGQEICHDDGYGYDEEGIHQQECITCEKTFTFFTEVSFNYTPYKADCLNGGEHVWKDCTHLPNYFKSARRCTACGKEERIPHDKT